MLKSERSFIEYVYWKWSCIMRCIYNVQQQNRIPWNTFIRAPSCLPTFFLFFFFVSFSLETAIACSHYILIILITINAYLINLRHHAVRQYAFNTNTNKSYLNNRSKSIIAVYGYYPFFFYFFPSPFLLLPPSPFFFTNVSERCRNYLKYICIDDNHRY